jgi:hypothetical protein
MDDLKKGKILILWGLELLPLSVLPVASRYTDYAIPATHAHARARTRTHTHTHTHIYIYIYIYILGGDTNLFFIRLSLVTSVQWSKDLYASSFFKRSQV